MRTKITLYNYTLTMPIVERIKKLVIACPAIDTFQNVAWAKKYQRIMTNQRYSCEIMPSKTSGKGPIIKHHSRC